MSSIWHPNRLIAKEEMYLAFRDALRDELRLGPKPSIAYGSTTTADAAIASVVPPADKYVYLIALIATVGADGDQVEGQALDTGAVWRTVFKPKLLANTSVVLGFPNLKLDKVIVAGTEYTVVAGDGATATFKILSRGTGPWEATLLYFCDA